ncbi:sulfite exporter TauE/SafE family protein [Halorarum salinum]|uniref:Probable membrane transporter protein n=1 Tax=Halorarum salinum TaxID=2743089 RepID=A0A7D5LDJ7_9EURY|nr:sulfite exporter TauE/SafE family protein [Halobaculum salinum]
MGITAVGPGGVFVTAALYALLDIPPGTVAGTASATFVATGLLGTATYLRSGELGDRGGAVAAGLLSLGGIFGALVGVRLNAMVSEQLFGYLLGAFLTLSGVLVWHRARGTTDERRTLDPSTWSGRVAVTVIGFAVGVPGGLLGVGGPVIAVPLLVVVGMPMLLAVALAQVQSVFLAAGATAGYVAQGAVSWPLAALVGVPELVGVIAGWHFAQHTNPARLKRGLAVLLVVLGPYLVLS